MSSTHTLFEEKLSFYRGSDFNILTENNKTNSENKFVYFDKTAIINRFINTKYPVILTAPSGFGKTTLLSMLDCFFNIEYAGNDCNPFETQSIWKMSDRNDTPCSQFYRKYPVLRLSFLNCFGNTFSEFKDSYKYLIRELYSKYRELFASLPASDIRKQNYTGIMNNSDGDILFRYALKYLTAVLRDHYKNKVIFLVDEYDAPFINAMTHNYNKQLHEYLDTNFDCAIKDNNNVEFSIITGIFPIKFDNFNCATYIDRRDDRFADYFGFNNDNINYLFPNITDQMLLKMHQEFGNHLIGKEKIFQPFSFQSHYKKQLVNFYPDSDFALTYLNKLQAYFVRKIYNDLIELLKIDSATSLTSVDINRVSTTSMSMKHPSAEGFWLLLVHQGLLNTATLNRETTISISNEFAKIRLTKLSNHLEKEFKPTNRM